MPTPVEKLAIEGGEPAVPGGPPEWPLSDDSIRAALLHSLGSNHWGRYHGEAQERLKARLRERTTREQAWLCSSGTIAVEMALRALKLGEGDEVLLSGYDFPGNFRAIEAVGARPVLCDIDPNSWSMCVESASSAIGPKTRAVIASHLHGGQVDMPKLIDVATDAGIAVVEDACQCPGATVFGKPAGSWGDLSIFSFGGSKLLSAGRGGAVMTNRSDLAQRIKSFAERGNDAFPLSELQATVLLPQMNQLDAYNEQRAMNASWLFQQLQLIDSIELLGSHHESCVPAYYKFPVRLHRSNSLSSERDVLIRAIQAEGVAIDIGFRGFTKRSTNRCRKPVPLAHSQLAAESTLLIHHPILLADPQVRQQTVHGIRKVFAAIEDESL